MTRHLAVLMAAGGLAVLAAVAVWRETPSDVHGVIRRDPAPVSTATPSGTSSVQRDAEPPDPRAARAESGRALETDSVDGLRAVLASTGKRRAAARMDALALLRDRDEQDGFERCLEHLADRDAGVRAVAAALLADARDTRAIPPLREALERERNPQARAAIAAAIVEIDPEWDDQGLAGGHGDAARGKRQVWGLVRDLAGDPHHPSEELRGRDTPPVVEESDFPQ